MMMLPIYTQHTQYFKCTSEFVITVEIYREIGARSDDVQNTFMLPIIMFFIHPSFFILILSLDIIENFLFSCILSHIICCKGSSSRRKKMRRGKVLRESVQLFLEIGYGFFFSSCSFLRFRSFSMVLQKYINTEKKTIFLLAYTCTGGRVGKKNYEKSLFSRRVPPIYGFHISWGMAKRYV